MVKTMAAFVAGIVVGFLVTSAQTGQVLRPIMASRDQCRDLVNALLADQRERRDEDHDGTDADQ